MLISGVVKSEIRSYITDIDGRQSWNNFVSCGKTSNNSVLAKETRFCAHVSKLLLCYTTNKNTSTTSTITYTTTTTTYNKSISLFFN